MQRPNLVIVRAGNASLHPGWLLGPQERSWDLVVNYFGADPDIYRQDDVVRIDSVGPKWPPLHQLLLDHPEYLDRYDYIWLPDDDLAMSKQDMNRFFALCAENQLELAHPSLKADSPMTHPLLIHNTATRVRYTNFVEAMAPCFSAPCLRRALDTFSESQSGWGIDWLWPKFVQDRERGIAVIDDVIIRHTRPLGGPNYDAMRAAGKSPRDELLRLQERKGVTDVRIRVHKAVWRSPGPNRADLNSRALALRLFLGSSKALLKSSARWTLFKQLVRRSISV